MWKVNICALQIVEIALFQGLRKVSQSRDTCRKKCLKSYWEYIVNNLWRSWPCQALRCAAFSFPRWCKLPVWLLNFRPFRHSKSLFYPSILISSHCRLVAYHPSETFHARFRTFVSWNLAISLFLPPIIRLTHPATLWHALLINFLFFNFNVWFNYRSFSMGKRQSRA